jgi:anti-sigma factor ChrR (cupin superfamily)
MMCRQAVEAVTDASEGALSGWRRLAYGLHLAMCPACRAHREQMETTVGVLHGAPRPDPSEEARRRALEAFQNRKKSSV